MKISGVVQFQAMSASGINLIREFQRNYPNIHITFSADFSAAVVEWKSFNSLDCLTRLAASVQASDQEPKPLQSGH